MALREERDADDQAAPGGRPGTAGAVETLSATDFGKIADEFAVEVANELAAREPIVRDWQKWQKVYLAKPSLEEKTYPFKGCSNVVVALAGEYSEQMHARIMQSVFAPEPLWVGKQRNRKYAMYAKPLERYLDAVRQDVWDQFAVCEDSVMETVKLGTSGIYNDWIDETTYRYDERMQMTVAAGRVIGPAPRWQPLEDILVPQGYANHQTSPWLGIRSWYSMTRLRELAFRGAVLDVDALEGHPDEETQLRMARRSGAAGRTPSAPETGEAGVYSPWTIFFRRDLDGDGYPEEYVMMLHLATKTILRFKPNPYPSAMRPLVVTRFVQVEGEFYGRGIPEMIEHAQAEVSAIHNERRDNGHLANIRMYKSRMTSNIADTIRPESGKVIKLVDPNDLEEFKVSDNRQVDIYEEQVVTDQASRRIGINDLAQGRMTSPMGRASATTVMALLQEGAQRFDMNITKIRRALDEQGMQIAELYQTHGLPEPDEPGSPEQFLDAEEAALVRELLSYPDNLRGIVRVRLNAATSSVNREIERQNNVQLYGVITNYIGQAIQMGVQIGNPMIPPELKVAMIRNFRGLDDSMRLIFESFNRFDLESVLVADLMANLAAQAIKTQAIMSQNPALLEQMTAQQGGEVPEAGAPPPAQQPTGAPGSGPAVSPYEAAPGMNGGGGE